jgi:hypothetical protein
LSNVVIRQIYSSAHVLLSLGSIAWFCREPIRYKMFMINSPWIFKASWNIIKAWIHPATRENIFIIGGEAEYHKEMAKFGITRECLPEFMGGTHAPRPMRLLLKKGGGKARASGGASANTDTSESESESGSGNQGDGAAAVGASDVTLENIPTHPRRRNILEGTLLKRRKHRPWLWPERHFTLLGNTLSYSLTPRGKPKNSYQLTEKECSCRRKVVNGKPCIEVITKHEVLELSPPEGPDEDPVCSEWVAAVNQVLFPPKPITKTRKRNPNSRSTAEDERPWEASGQARNKRASKLVGVEVGDGGTLKGRSERSGGVDSGQSPEQSNVHLHSFSGSPKGFARKSSAVPTVPTLEPVTEKGSKGWILESLRATLQQGVTAEEAALCSAIGIMGGLWPVPFTSTPICFVLQTIFRVRPVLATVIQALNVMMTPLEIVCFPVYIRWGEDVLIHWEQWNGRSGDDGASSSSGYQYFDPSTLVATIVATRDVAIFHATSRVLLLGVMVWLVTLPVAMAIVYAITKPMAAWVLPSSSSGSTDSRRSSSSASTSASTSTSTSTNSSTNIDTSMHCKFYELPPKDSAESLHCAATSLVKGCGYAARRLQIQDQKWRMRVPAKRAGWDESGYGGWRMSTFRSEGATAAESELVAKLRTGVCTRYSTVQVCTRYSTVQLRSRWCYSPLKKERYARGAYVDTLLATVDLCSELRTELAECPQHPELVGSWKLLRFIRGHHTIKASAKAFRDMLEYRRNRGVEEVRAELVRVGESYYSRRIIPPYYSSLHLTAFSSPRCSFYHADTLALQGWALSKLGLTSCRSSARSSSGHGRGQAHRCSMAVTEWEMLSPSRHSRTTTTIGSSLQG